MVHNFPLIGDHHTEGVACVAAYLGQRSHADIALAAATCLADYARLLHDLAAAPDADAAAPAADGDSPPPVLGLQGSLSLPADPERLWWPLCEALALAVGTDPRAAVRSAALTSLFGVLEAELAAGGALHGPFGLRVFGQLVLPIFDALPAEAATSSLAPAQAAWVENTGLPALAALERAFCGAGALLAPLLDDVIALLVRCLQQPHHPGLARVAAESLLQLVRETGASFSQETWALVCAALKSCFAASAADAYAGGAAAGTEGAVAASPLLREVSAKVQAEAPEGSGPYELQVLLLSTVYQLLQSMYPSMKLSDVEGLLNCMHTMYGKAASTVEGALGGEAQGAEGGEPAGAGAGSEGGASSAVEVEEASHLKLEAMSYYLQVLFLLHAKLEPGAALPVKGAAPPLGSAAHVLLIATAAEYRLVSFCLHALRDYLKTREAVAAAGGSPEQLRLAEAALTGLTPNVVMLLRGVLAFSEPQFSKHLPAFYPLFADLIHCESKQIATVLRELFAQRIAPHLQQATT